jgi:hypothetical protein
MAASEHFAQGVIGAKFPAAADFGSSPHGRVARSCPILPTMTTMSLPGTRLFSPPLKEPLYGHKALVKLSLQKGTRVSPDYKRWSRPCSTALKRRKEMPRFWPVVQTRQSLEQERMC